MYGPDSGNVLFLPSTAIRNKKCKFFCAGVQSSDT